MRNVDLFELEHAAAPGGFVLRRKGDSGFPALNVEGEVLEWQAQMDTGEFLVWTSDGVPYEEGLHIYLLSGNGEILDRIDGGASFCAGVLKILSVGDRSVRFEFFTNGFVYELKIHGGDRFRLIQPWGWRYPNIFRKHRLEITLLKPS